MSITLKYQDTWAFMILGIVFHQNSLAKPFDSFLNRNIVLGQFVISVPRNQNFATCY